MRLDKKLLARTGSMQGYLLLSCLLGLLVAAGTITQAVGLSRVIDGVFLAGQTLEQALPWLLLLLLVMVGRALLSGANEIIAAAAAGRAKRNLREPLFAHLLLLGPAFSNRERSGELSNSATEGVEALDAYFSQYLPQLFLSAIVPLAVLAAVTATDLLSGLVLALTAPLLPVFMILVGKLAEASSKKQWQQMSLLSAHFLDVLQGLPTLKQFNRSKQQLAQVTRIGEQYRDVTLKVLRVAFLSALILELGATISTAIVAVEVGLRLLYSQISFGPALFVLLLAPEFYAPFRALGARFHAAMNGNAAADRILAILELPAPQNGSTTASPVEPTLQPISFELVSFSYSAAGERERSLEEVSFTIRPGCTLAVVGPSGAGKSTILNLLLRFNEPSGGRIMVGDRPLAAISPDEWRKTLAWMPQQPYLFARSVADNIRLGRPDAPLDQVIAAASAAGADGFIRLLPQGYDTPLGERGARLSGGEAQRIGLARAFLLDAPLLLLDEPAAHLDPENEEQLLRALERLMINRTVVLITHRLALAERCDSVLQLDHGRVIAGATPVSGSAADLHGRMLAAAVGEEA